MTFMNKRPFWPRLVSAAALFCAFAAGGGADMTQIQCGNLIYQGTKSSVCFADRFLTEAAHQTNLRVAKSFYPVKLESDALFETPFCVFSGDKTFVLTQRERDNLKKYLLNGGFILASPSCSDENWDASFRREIKLCFPDRSLAPIPMSHPIFSVVNKISRLTDKYGKPKMIEGLEIDGRLGVVYSKDGLNDVSHAEGCCCCGGNQINECLNVNVNVLTYALLY
jgi:hypothetical protein